MVGEKRSADLHDASERLARPKSEIVREAILQFHARIRRLNERERTNMLRVFDEMVPKIPVRSRAVVAREVSEPGAARRSEKADYCQIAIGLDTSVLIDRLSGPKRLAPPLREVIAPDCLRKWPSRKRCFRPEMRSLSVSAMLHLALDSIARYSRRGTGNRHRGCGNGHREGS
jgi:hypothetical protein